MTENRTGNNAYKPGKVRRYVLIAIELKDRLKVKTDGEVTEDNVSITPLGMADSLYRLKDLENGFLPFVTGRGELLDVGQVDVSPKTDLPHTAKAYQQDGTSLAFGYNGGTCKKTDGYVSFMCRKLNNGIANRGLFRADEGTGVIYVIKNFLQKGCGQYTIQSDAFVSLHPSKEFVSLYNESVRLSKRRQSGKPKEHDTELRKYLLPCGRKYADLSIKERRELFDKGLYKTVTVSFISHSELTELLKKNHTRGGT